MVPVGSMYVLRWTASDWHHADIVIGHRIHRASFPFLFVCEPVLLSSVLPVCVCFGIFVRQGRFVLF